MTRSRLLLSALLVLSAGLAACQSGDGDGAHEETATPATATAATPILIDGSAYETAMAVPMEARSEEHPDDGLHNFFTLSDTIMTGAEPVDEDALRTLSEMGVKTILSVDGKIPDAATAAKYGMRYVHVPIQYKGVEAEQAAEIAKTFRELPAPFYVHCFHGKHRGPAGAAIGRLVLDGTSREQALGEMGQWCGTSKKYEGLFRTIAEMDLPSADTTAALDFDFAPAHAFEGLRGMMVPTARSWDYLKLLVDRGWEADPEHPDVDAYNEADKMAQAFGSFAHDAALGEEPEDLQEWYRASVTETAALRDALQRHRGGDRSAAADAVRHFRAVGNLCSTCHKSYRND